MQFDHLECGITKEEPIVGHTGVDLGGNEGLGEGVHGVLQGADAVDGLAVLGSEFDLAIVCPDGCCSLVIRHGAELQKVGRREILVDPVLGAGSVGVGDGGGRENVLLELDDEVSDEGV